MKDSEFTEVRLVLDGQSLKPERVYGKYMFPQDFSKAYYPFIFWKYKFFTESPTPTIKNELTLQIKRSTMYT